MLWRTSSSLCVGLCMYVGWNIFTLLGVVLGKSIPGLDQLGLEFSIAATFIANNCPDHAQYPSSRLHR